MSDDGADTAGVRVEETDGGLFHLVTAAGARLGGFAFSDAEDARTLARQLVEVDGFDGRLQAQELRQVPGLRAQVEQLAQALPSYVPPRFPEPLEGKYTGASYDADYDARRRAARDDG